MTAETIINKELLAAVRDKIRETPAAYNQATFGRPSKDAPCGTAACVAGWAAVLSGRFTLRELFEVVDTDEVDVIAEAAQEALGFTEEEADCVFTGTPNSLYADSRWPEPFATRYGAATTESDRARVAADFLQHIIDTGKVTN